jgi:hypothetical protein
MNKAHIIREIKRTTIANGGVPLGKNKFEHETGIKETDWFGKIWARWGDAIREAGFIPNKLNTAFDKAEVFSKFAQLARELGRIPVRGDLRLKKRNDSKFPNEKVFDRFGTRPDFIKELADYCRKNEYEDIVPFCDKYLAFNCEVAEKSEAPKEQIGFVYLIKSGRFYKIGRANSAGRREYELAIQLPEKASTVHVIRTDDPNGIEAYWHNRFALKRKNGEWFELNASDISAFKRRKFM